MLNFHVARVAQYNHGTVANLGSQTTPIQNRRFSRFAAKCYVPLGRIAGGCDGDPLAIFSTANVDGVSWLGHVGRSLHRQERLIFSARIGIASMGRHI